MIKKIKRSIEFRRGSKNFLWKALVSLKDVLHVFSVRAKFLGKKLRYNFNRMSWKLRKKTNTRLDVTLLYLNWKRKDLLLRILEDAKQQSGEFEIVVVDNSGYDQENAINPSGVKVVKADNSNKCWERWVYAKEVGTKYVCVMDDDMTFVKRNIIESCYNYMESHPEVDCVGAFGVQYDPEKGYWGSLHVKNLEEDMEVSIAKGRFMFIRTESLQGLDMEPDLTCDDIKASSHLSKKVLLKDVAGGFFDLIETDTVGVSSQIEHNSKRENAVKKYFDK